MPESGGFWEMLIAGLMALFVIWWFSGGIKNAFERSKNAPKDWMGAIIPIALVVLFVLFLIVLVRN